MRTLLLDGKFFKQEQVFEGSESETMKLLVFAVLPLLLASLSWTGLPSSEPSAPGQSPYLSGQAAEVASRADIEVRRDGRSWAVIESDGDVRIDGRSAGVIEDDGDVRKDGRGIGVVEADGDIRWDGRHIGVIESDGDLRIDGRHIGVIEPDGDIRHEGRSWGTASNVHCYEDVRRVAALLVFFSGDFCR